jgi:hypothetical protein
MTLATLTTVLLVDILSFIHRLTGGVNALVTLVALALITYSGLLKIILRLELCPMAGHTTPSGNMPMAVPCPVAKITGTVMLATWKDLPEVDDGNNSH